MEYPKITSFKKIYKKVIQRQLQMRMIKKFLKKDSQRKDKKLLIIRYLRWLMWLIKTWFLQANHFVV